MFIPIPRAVVSRFVCAIALCSTLSSISCSSPHQREERYLKRGKDLLAKKDYASAALEFKNAIGIEPKDAEPYFQLALAYLQSGATTGAIIALQKAVEVDPKHTGAQGAADRLRNLTAGSSENADANEILALAEWKLGKAQDAIKRLEGTLERFPAHLDSSVALARLKVNQRDLKGAEAVLRKAVAAKPDSAEAALALRQVLALLGNAAAAERELSRAVRIDPNNGAALMNLAFLQLSANPQNRRRRYVS
jgi:cytochrome c-type biogenesis protein CcmH/NrfG